MAATVPFDVGLEWSEWTSLQPTDELKDIPKEPGICRISHRDTGGIEFVGRSYRDIRHRLQDLGIGLRKNEVPDTEPHSAAPILWSLAERIGYDFVVSWCELSDEDADTIDSLWAVYLATLRRIVGRSPSANFGQDIRIEGDFDTDQGSFSEFAETRDYVEVDYQMPTWENWQDVTFQNWMGLDWEPAKEFGVFSRSFPSTAGVYRVWHPDSDTLEVIDATSNLEARIKKRGDDFAQDARISWCKLDIKGSPKRTEVEVDLIGAHYIAKNIAPVHDISGFESIDDRAERLIERQEDSDIEFTDWRCDRPKIVEELVALANAGGGHFFIGIDDDSRESLPYHDIDTKEGMVRNVAKDRIEPTMRLTVHKPKYDGNRVLWVKVPQPKYHLYSGDGQFKIRSATGKQDLGWQDIKNFIINNPKVLSEMISKAEFQGIQQSDFDSE